MLDILNKLCFSREQIANAKLVAGRHAGRQGGGGGGQGRLTGRLFSSSSWNIGQTLLPPCDFQQCGISTSVVCSLHLSLETPKDFQSVALH